MKYGEGAMGASTMAKPTIGIFDVDANGATVANDIQQALPEYEVLYATRQAGTNLLGVLRDLVKRDCRVIVILSDVLTIEDIHAFRRQTNIPIIDMESPRSGGLAPRPGQASFEAVINAARRAASVQRSKD